MTQPATLEKVSAILLQDGWHPVTQFETFNLASPVAWKGFSARESSGTYLFGPTSALQAIRGPKYVSPEEQAEFEAAKRLEEDRAFEWQHYADPETYFATVAGQQGKCGSCEVLLDQSPITHFEAATNKVLCQHCTSLVHRYGRP